MRKISLILLTLALFIASHAMAQPAPTQASDAGTKKAVADAGSAAPAKEGKDTSKAELPTKKSNTNTPKAATRDNSKAVQESASVADQKGKSATKSSNAEPAKEQPYAWKGTKAEKAASDFVKALSAKRYQTAYDSWDTAFKQGQTLDDFKEAITEAKLDQKGSIRWDDSALVLPNKRGYKLLGSFVLASEDDDVKKVDGKSEGAKKKGIPVYIKLLSDAEVGDDTGDNKWDTNITWTIVEFGAAGRAKFLWKTANSRFVATQFVTHISAENFKVAFETGGKKLQENRDLETFSTDMRNANLNQAGSVKWEKGNNALQANNGYKLMGTFSPKKGESFPVYMHLEGDAHVDAKKRNRKWDEKTKWTVMDYRSAQSFYTRVNEGTGSSLDWFLYISLIIYLIAVIGLLISYIPGLWGHPRELWLMFFTKVTEYSAYGAASVVFILFLQKEVLISGEPLGDSFGYQYYLVWGIVATIITMMVGAVCDTIGVKKCLLIGAVMLLISRFFMPLSDGIVAVTILGFLPLAFGFAITGPVLKVGIKWFTTLKSATLGFGLFYTLMNIGFTVGALIADYFRKNHADGIDNVMGLGFDLTAYQAIIGIGFLINIPDFIAILFMREGAEMTETGVVISPQEKADDIAISEELRGNIAERRQKMWGELKISMLWTWGFALTAYILFDSEIHKWKVFDVIKAGSYVWAFAISIGLFAIGGLIYAGSSIIGTFYAGRLYDRVMKTIRDSTEGTVAQLKENFTEKPFWIYMVMLGILTFVKLAFYIFHVMFQPYAIRVFGDDFPIGSLFGTLNPAMIVLLVPLVSWATVKIRSYTMLMFGTALSALSVFLCFLPTDMAIWLGDTWFGSTIYDYWVEAPIGGRDPFLMSLIIFIIVFTIGEAIWSPRLMQFSAEIAPRGKEGAYIALAVLPYFFGKIFATVMADILTSEYFSAEMVEYPDHQMAWFWIAIMCMLSPVGMILFRGTFNQSEKMAEDEAEATRAIEGSA